MKECRWVHRCDARGAGGQRLGQRKWMRRGRDKGEAERWRETQRKGERRGQGTRKREGECREEGKEEGTGIEKRKGRPSREGERERWKWCVWVQGSAERGRGAYLVGRSPAALRAGEDGEALWKTKMEDEGLLWLRGCYGWSCCCGEIWLPWGCCCVRLEEEDGESRSARES